MDEVEPVRIDNLEDSLGRAFDIYKTFWRIRRLFDGASQYANYVPNGDKMSLDIGLNLLLASILRPFSFTSRDLQLFTEHVDNANAITGEEISHNLLKRIIQLFDKFCENYIKNKNCSFISDIKSPESYGINKNSRRSAVNSFKETFYFLIKKRKLFLIAVSDDYSVTVNYVGVTLYDGRILIVQDTDIGNSEDRVFWYTLVLIHELCHLHRLRGDDYMCEKYTPAKLGYESGNYAEINVFGNIMRKKDEGTKTIKLTKYTMEESPPNSYNEAPYFSLIDKLARVHDFKAFVNNFET